MQNVFERDQLSNTAPMTDYIPNPDALSPEFSTVSYNKGTNIFFKFGAIKRKTTKLVTYSCLCSVDVS